LYEKKLEESLNQKDKKKLENIYDQLLQSKRYKSAFYSINSIVETLTDNGFYLIGEGSFRSVYSKENAGFVIKVAKNEEGIESNNKEISVSHPSTKSISVKNIIPEIYEFDRRYDPLWVICEKVKPIKLASYKEIKRIFPTFFKVLISHSLFKNENKEINRKTIIQLIEDTYLFAVKNNVTDKSAIIDFLLYRVYSNDSIKVKSIIENEKFLDINHFLKSTSYDYTSDLYTRNLGVRNSVNPSPEDFVILDFDTQFQKKDSFVKLHNFNVDNLNDPGFVSLNSDFSDDIFSTDINNESIAELIYVKLLSEISYDKIKYNGSHPEESYQYGWPEFDESEFDK